MKKLIMTGALCAILSCVSLWAQITLPDAEAAKAQYAAFSITPNDKTVTINAKTVTIAPKKEGVTYRISGYYSGQIINKTKNTVLKFNNAYIENTEGKSAVYGEAKTEISTAEGTTNWIISKGTSDAKIAALHSKKDLEIGGSGTLYVSGFVRHGIKGDDVKLKGSGILYAQGAKNGSAINCRTLVCARDKTIRVYLINSKNAVKADNTIALESGTYYLYGNGTAFKTDTQKDDPKSPHFVKLSGGTFHSSKNGTFCSTEANGYTSKGAKIIEE